jgi:hypothetical protein
VTAGANTGRSALPAPWPPLLRSGLATPVRNHLRHQPTFAALLDSAALFAVGSVLFGVFLLRTRAYPRPLCLAYTVFPALLAALSPLPESPLKNTVHCLAGLTIAWLAITLWRTTPPRHPRPTAAARQPDCQGSQKHPARSERR